MPLLNYTTTVSALSTAGTIEAILVKAGAQEVRKGYGLDGSPATIVFEINERLYVLPCRQEAVLGVLRNQKVEARYKTPAHAQRVAWRILKDWVEAQLAIIESGMVDLEEVMIAFQLDYQTGKSLYEGWKEGQAGKMISTRK